MGQDHLPLMTLVDFPPAPHRSQRFHPLWCLRRQSMSLEHQFPLPDLMLPLASSALVQMALPLDSSL